MCMWVSVWVYAHVSLWYVEVREQPERLIPLPLSLHGPRGLNLGGQFWPQVPVPSEPSPASLHLLWGKRLDNRSCWSFLCPPHSALFPIVPSAVVAMACTHPPAISKLKAMWVYQTVYTVLFYILHMCVIIHIHTIHVCYYTYSVTIIPSLEFYNYLSAYVPLHCLTLLYQTLPLVNWCFCQCSHVIGYPQWVLLSAQGMGFLWGLCLEMTTYRVHVFPSNQWPSYQQHLHSSEFWIN